MGESDLRLGRTGFTRSEMWLMVALLIFGLVVSVLGTLLTYKNHLEIAKLFAGAGITLLYGAIFGGVVKLLIDNFDRRRAQRAAQIDFISNVLSDLKGVHDRLDRGRTLIIARRSAKTYGEEMLAFIEASVTLKNVTRALETDERRNAIAPVRKEVEQMNGYLRGLLDEFEEHYKEVSLLQSIFEAHKDKALHPPPSDYALEAMPRNVPWERLEKLDRLKDFLMPLTSANQAGEKTVSDYQKSFLMPLNSASKGLRQALSDQVSRS